MSSWQHLEIIRGPVALPHRWAESLGPEFPAFKTLCLQPDDWQVESYACPANCGCRHRVIPIGQPPPPADAPRNTDHATPNTLLPLQRSNAPTLQPPFIASCQCRPPTCPDFTLTEGQITPLKIHWPRLARALCRALSLAPRFDQLPPHNTAQVGSWSAGAVPVILTIKPDEEHFRAVINELGMRLQKPFILLAPTSVFLTAATQELLNHSQAAFFPLETTVAITAEGTLAPLILPAHLFAMFNAGSTQHAPRNTPPRTTPRRSDAPRTTTPTVRYSLRKGLGVWHLIFDGHEADLRHERGLFFVAWLLYNPPDQPLHAIDLMAKIPEIYRQQLGLTQLTDPTTGKTATLESHARIQERSLALDDAQTLRALFKKQRQLEAILDTDETSEPEKAEALRELEEIYTFQKHHAATTKDAPRTATRTTWTALHRLRRNLLLARDTKGNTHPVLNAFANHIAKHILTPSARYARPGRAARPSGFTYEQPQAISWAP